MAVAKIASPKVNKARVSATNFETFGNWQLRIHSESASEPRTPHGGTHYPKSEAEYEGDSGAIVHIPQVLPPEAGLKKPPQSVKLQNESLINNLKDEIWDLWAVKTLENWFWTGQKLMQLKAERAKPGSGKYMADLAELGIPYWTAQRRINFYGSVMEGHDPSLFRHLHNANDASKWLVEDVVTAEQAALKKAADEKLKKRKEAIEAEHAQLQRDLLDKKKHTPEYRFWIYLPSVAKRKLFFDAWHNKLGHRRASALVVKVILNAANRHKGKRASKRHRS
jgi:hypothetical protein